MRGRPTFRGVSHFVQLAQRYGKGAVAVRPFHAVFRERFPPSKYDREIIIIIIISKRKPPLYSTVDTPRGDSICCRTISRRIIVNGNVLAVPRAPLLTHGCLHECLHARAACNAVGGRAWVQRLTSIRRAARGNDNSYQLTPPFRRPVLRNARAKASDYGITIRRVSRSPINRLPRAQPTAAPRSACNVPLES